MGGAQAAQAERSADAGKGPTACSKEPAEILHNIVPVGALDLLQSCILPRLRLSSEGPAFVRGRDKVIMS